MKIFHTLPLEFKTCYDMYKHFSFSKRLRKIDYWSEVIKFDDLIQKKKYYATTDFSQLKKHLYNIKRWEASKELSIR